ncbi:MAG: heavy-metal-associated domain-containing protein [Coriobacteriia bacterium]|nr:heavy-metal-associated domain-containing protein [Coriobacteriia bacterium]
MSVSMTLKIDGMTCDNCVKHVREALESLPTVQKAEVSLKKEQAKVTSSAELDVALIRQAIEDAGYELAAVL